MIVVLTNCKLQYSCVRNADVLYLWNYKTVSFLNKFLRKSNLISFTDRNLFLKTSAQYDSSTIQCSCLRSTKLISGEISTSNHSLYFVAVNWLQITDGHALTVLDTHSTLHLNVEEKYIRCHLQLDCHGHVWYTRYRSTFVFWHVFVLKPEMTNRCMPWNIT